MRKILHKQNERDTETIGRYLDAIGDEARLSDEEVEALARRVRLGDDAALSRLTRANLKFVVSIAKQYRGLGLDLFDLINEGNLGLIKAAQRFDPSKGVSFLSYAVWWIRQSIGEAVAAVQREREIDGPSLNATRGDGHNTLLDYIEGEGPRADEPMLGEAERDAMHAAIRQLLPREQQVIAAAYGVGGEQLTLAEIARQMGVTRERVRQIRKRGLRRLHQHLRDAR